MKAEIWVSILIGLAAIFAGMLEWQIAWDMGYWRIVLSILVGGGLAAILAILYVKFWRK